MTFLFKDKYSAKIDTVAFILFADSKKTTVSLNLDKDYAISICTFLFLGKNPLKLNAFEGSPDKINALITDDGPGNTVNWILFLMHSCDKKYPGSEMHGAPASEIIAISKPALSCLKIGRAHV